MNNLVLDKVGMKMEGCWLMQDASLTLSPGQLSAFIGPNGAGKTTLLRLLAGLWQPNKGHVSINGRNLHHFQRQSLAQNITFVAQNTAVDFAFTVQDIVMMGRNPHLGRFQPEGEYDYHCVEQAMLKTDIAHLAKRQITELSGGERQRTLIARSLATFAPIILLDEPTASLDIAHALEILDLCKELTGEGKTVAFSTHDINHAIRYANQVVLVDNGHIVNVDSADKVLTDTAISQVFGVNIEKISVSKKEKFFFFRRGEMVN